MRQPRILLIDDEPAHRMLSRRALLAQAADADIVEAGSLSAARTAIAPFKCTGLSLAIVDLNLGEESGLTLVNELRPVFGDGLIIIVLSTSDLLEDQHRSYRAGINCYLLKSTDIATFQSELQAAVRFFLR